MYEIGRHELQSAASFVFYGKALCASAWTEVVELSVRSGIKWLSKRLIYRQGDQLRGARWSRGPH